MTVLIKSRNSLANPVFLTRRYIFHVAGSNRTHIGMRVLCSLPQASGTPHLRRCTVDVCYVPILVEQSLANELRVKPTKMEGVPAAAHGHESGSSRVWALLGSIFSNYNSTLLCAINSNHSSG